MSKKPPGTRVEVYRTRRAITAAHIPQASAVSPLGDWRWRRVKNGKITHASTEGYHNFKDCMNNLQTIYVCSPHQGDTLHSRFGPIVFLADASKPRSRIWWLHLVWESGP